MIMNKQITFRQKCSSQAQGLLNLVQILMKYRNAYQNYLSVLKHIIQKRYPAEAILRNGQEITLNGFEISYNLARLQDQNQIQYDIVNDIVQIPDDTFSGSKGVKLKGGLSNGEIVNIFVNKVYHRFPVKGKMVIDVGANIADSCIYFVLNGAERVVGVEPLPENYNIAQENIRLNNYSSKIIVLLAGCSAEEGSINIDPHKGIGIQIHRGKKMSNAIPSFTLEQILRQANIGDGEVVLKIDCEGCEYDIISSASDDLLKRFSHILIEYHHGYKIIKERLDKCNFDVTLVNVLGQPGGPIAVPDLERPKRWYYMGYIQAKRKLVEE
jgi:FkbM family methyltransferase